MTAQSLDVHLFGSFRLVRDEKAYTTIDSPRLQSILANLILHADTPLPRRHLAFQLYPDATEPQARNNLRQVVLLLRRALPEAGAFLRIDSHTLQWAPDAPFTLDVADFKAAIARGALKQAVELYRGDLLPNCYDDWISPERERLRETYLGALDRLSHEAEDRRDYRTAISYTQMIFRHEPLCEPAHGRMMRLQLLADDPAAALRTYRECAAVLQRELGALPCPATRALYKKAQATPRLATQRPAASAAPFIGREAEWARLKTAWHAVESGLPQVVLLTGEAGIGKTRLAQEFVTWATRQGIPTASAICYKGSQKLPYAPAIHWLREHPLPALGRAWLAELAQLMPEILEQRPELVPYMTTTQAGQRQRLFEALARAIRAGRQTQLLLLDNAQWCDRETLDWLRYLLHAGTQTAVLLVMTARTEDVLRRTPLTAWAGDLRLTRSLTEIELPRLSDPETVALAQSVAAHPLDAASISRLHQNTEGHPLFVIESVRGREVGADEPTPFSTGIRASMEERLAQLTRAARELIDIAAAAGRQFSLPLLRQASGRAEAVFVRAMDELTRHRIVQECGDGQYKFWHEKLREFAYTGIGAARRQMVHRRLAEALEMLQAEDAAEHECATPAAQDGRLPLESICAQIAMHYQLAGAFDRAALYFWCAADGARQACEYEQAVELYGRALDCAQHLPPSRRAMSMATLLEGRGDVRELADQHAQAQSDYELALRHTAPDHASAYDRLRHKLDRTEGALVARTDTVRAERITLL
jgi:DNA-binding SARP family transcriptional activator